MDAWRAFLFPTAYEYGRYNYVDCWDEPINQPRPDGRWQDIVAHVVPLNPHHLESFEDMSRLVDIIEVEVEVEVGGGFTEALKKQSGVEWGRSEGWL
jgi:hypothetical protein